MDANNREIRVPLGTRLKPGQTWIGHDSIGGRAARRRHQQQVARGLFWCTACEQWLPQRELDHTSNLCIECRALSGV